MELPWEKYHATASLDWVAINSTASWNRLVTTAPESRSLLLQAPNNEHILSQLLFQLPGGPAKKRMQLISPSWTWHRSNLPSTNQNKWVCLKIRYLPPNGRFHKRDTADTQFSNKLKNMGIFGTYSLLTYVKMLHYHTTLHYTSSLQKH